MNYKNYQNARDAAWKILLDCDIDRLPVDLNVVCRKLKIRALSYRKGQRMIERVNLSHAAHRTDGMTFFVRDTPVILFDDKTAPLRTRFTIAHELGHIILGHVRPGDYTVANREPQPGDAPEETAANQFAARLLAPACVLWGLDVHTPEDIMALCRISRQAAEFRARRMEDLYRRNKFLVSPVEREVYEQFKPFIKATANPPPGG